jgi:type I restriction enzyme S subunit
MLLRPGDLFVSLKDVTQSADLLGAVARVPPSVELGRLTQDTVKLELSSNQRDVARILYRALLTPGYREYCRAHATGTTNLGLSREDFLAYPICLPEDSLLVAFNSLMCAIEKRIDVALEEAAALAQLRGELLPRLVSGELRIADFRQPTGQVA